MGKKKFDQEGRSVILEYEDFYLVNVYVPNSKRKLLRLKERVGEWDVLLREKLVELSKSKAVILVGDLNVAHKEIDLKDP